MNCWALLRKCMIHFELNVRASVWCSFAMNIKAVNCWVLLRNLMINFELNVRASVWWSLTLNIKAVNCWVLLRKFLIHFELNVMIFFTFALWQWGFFLIACGELFLWADGAGGVLCSSGPMFFSSKVWPSTQTKKPPFFDTFRVSFERLISSFLDRF